MTRVSMIVYGWTHQVDMPDNIANDLWSAWWKAHNEKGPNLFSGSDENGGRFSYRIDQIIGIEMSSADASEKDRQRQDRERSFNLQERGVIAAERLADATQEKREPWERDDE